MMKRILSNSVCILSAIAAIATSCSREEVRDIREESDRIVFRGNLQPASRTSISDDPAQTDSYQLKWESGDAIGILSYELYRTDNVNVKATLLESSAGNAEGSFVPEKNVSLPKGGSEHFLIYYPYRDDVNEFDVDTRGITATLPPHQTQKTVSNMSVGGNGFGWAFVNIADGQKEVNFTLDHIMSYLRFHIGTEYFNQGYQLHGVSVVDYDEKVPLSGQFSLNVLEGTMSPSPDKVYYYASVDTDSDDFSIGADGQELYLTLFPGDYNNANLYLVIKYADPAGNIYNLPLKWGKKAVLKPGTVYSVNLGKNVSNPRNIPAYYESKENRNYFGTSYAYGPQNTFFIESKAAGTGMSSLSFDVKLRGFYFGQPKPAYCGWLCASENGEPLLCFPDGDDLVKEVPDHTVGSDYKITVQCYDQGTAKGHWGVLAIYDEDYNILWSYMIISYLSGDEPRGIAYPDGRTMLDRNLGAAYGNAYAANIERCEKAAASFSWGRKDPYMYAQQEGYSSMLTTPGTGVGYALAHPNVNLAYDQNNNQSSGDWIYSEHRSDLWGKWKTIYDPCPEGWRVPDFAVLKDVYDNAEKRERAAGQAGQTPDRVGGSQFNDVSTLAYRLPDGSYDWWPYSGGRWNTSDSWSNRPGNSDHAAWYWSCEAVPGANTSYGFAVGYSSSGKNDSCGAFSRANGRLIRCQKED